MTDERQDGPHPSDRRPEAVRPTSPTAEDIGLHAIGRVIDGFYERVQDDPILGPRFAVVSNWTEHKARLAHFWWVLLGGSAYAPYRYRVVDAHRTLGVADDEIERWMTLFRDCVHAALPEPQAEAWLQRARAMSKSLSAITVEWQGPGR